MLEDPPRKEQAMTRVSFYPTVEWQVLRHSHGSVGLQMNKEKRVIGAVEDRSQV